MEHDKTTFSSSAGRMLSGFMLWRSPFPLASGLRDGLAYKLAGEKAQEKIS